MEIEHCLIWPSFPQVVGVEELSDLVEKSQKILVSASSNGGEEAMFKVVGDLVVHYVLGTVDGSPINGFGRSNTWLAHLLGPIHG
jgi:hypothetical protein